MSPREVVSADLDGEAGPEERAAAASHLEGCAACRSWEQRAAAVTRRARTAVDAGPDLVAVALAHAPRPRPRLLRPPVLARLGLGAIGLAQLLLGVVALLGAAAHATGGHADPAMGGADPGAALLGAGMAHVAHEAAAWNLALGAAFLVGALWPRHLAGLLPALGVFIALLAVLSAIDLAGGRVDFTRVVSHLLLVAGFALGLAVVRLGPYPRRGPAPGGRAGSRRPETTPAPAADRVPRPLDESAPDVA
jgi:predicted anti-sigma-YlaC factor YlaD